MEYISTFGPTKEGIQEYHLMSYLSFFTQDRVSAHKGKGVEGREKKKGEEQIERERENKIKVGRKNIYGILATLRHNRFFVSLPLIS